MVMNDFLKGIYLLFSGHRSLRALLSSGINMKWLGKNKNRIMVSFQSIFWFEQEMIELTHGHCDEGAGHAVLDPSCPSRARKDLEF